MSDFSAKILAILDSSKIPSQINTAIRDIEKRNIVLRNFILETKNLPSQIQASLDGHPFTIKLDGIKTDNLTSQAVKAGKTYADALSDRIGDELKNGKIEAAIASVTARYEKLGSTAHTKLAGIGKDLEKLNSLHRDMATETDSKKLVSIYEDYAGTLTRVKNNLTTVSAQTRTAVSSLQVVKLDNKIESWLKKNTRAAEQFGRTLEGIRNDLNSPNISQAEFDKLNHQFDEIVQNATSMGLVGETFGSRMGNTLKRAFSHIGAYEVFRHAKDALKEMAKNVLDVDTAMTSLYRVSDLTDKQYKEMYSSMVKSAKEYGAELKDLISQTADWTKLGFKPDDAEQLANITSMYQHITDLDNKTAVGNLVTAYKGYEKELLKLTGGDVTKAVEYVADIYNKLGNEFAIDAAQVGEGMTRSASALQVAGNSIQESSAMITGITEVTQDAAKAGNALRTLSMRLRGTTAQELEAIGEDAEGLIEVTSTMHNKLKDLTGVSLVDSSGNLRSTFNTMRDLAKVWNDLGGNTQSNVLEMIAGKNRASDVAALLSNWEQVEKALESATNAAGTAAEEQAIFMDSLQGKINQFKTAWQSLSNTILSSELLKFFVDAGTTILSTIDNITNSIGAIPTLIGLAFAGASIGKNVGELINQFQFRIILRVEYAHEAFTNSDVNEIAC